MMGDQSQIFLNGEGAAWLERNKDKLPPRNDPVIESLDTTLIKPKRVLEIGCSNGWRLNELAKKYNCACYGVDPARQKATNIYRGTADDLCPFTTSSFDLVIYGFCLYLCDPEDYFKIAAEGDRVLAENGHIAIYDFYTGVPHSTPYKHKLGVYSHKMDFSQLWLSHPAYSTVSIHADSGDGTAVIIINKKMYHAFPVTPE